MDCGQFLIVRTGKPTRWTIVSEAGLLEKMTGLELTFLTRFRGYAFFVIWRAAPCFSSPVQNGARKIDKVKFTIGESREMNLDYTHFFWCMRKKDVAKLQLLKYLISADGRDIYSTLKFDKEEKDGTLNEVLDDIDELLLHLFINNRIVYRIIDSKLRTT